MLGILSGALRQATGQVLAVPITAMQQALAAFLPPPERTATLEETIKMDGSVRVELSGNGGGDFGRTLSGLAKLETSPGAQQSPKMGNNVAIAGRGSERSECKEDLGRTISTGQASGLVFRAGEETIVIGVDLYAHGGHYRTAATCVLGEPVGLTGHDTMVRATAAANASIRIPVLDEATRAIRVTYTDLPQADASIEVVDQDGNTVSAQRASSSGVQEIPVDKVGLYTVRISVNSEAKAAGGFGEQRVRYNAQIRATRLSR